MAAKFTPAELSGLVAEAIVWLKQQREKFLPSGIPLNTIQKANLLPFFDTSLLGRLRIVDLSQRGETLPYPPFYEEVRAGGFHLVPDAAHMAAIPFIDVVVSNNEPTLRTIFHSLVHVTQFSVLGLETVMEGYFRVLNESGLWLVVPFEEQASSLTGGTHETQQTYSP